MASTQHFGYAARLQARWTVYAKDRRGATAVEFALIAAPFFFLIFGLLEVCLIFIMSTVMEHAVTEASRPLRTGEAQESAMTRVQFRQAICDELFDMLDCDGRLHIDVRTVDNFSGTPSGAPLDGDGDFDDDGFDFVPGGPNDIVAVRAFYEWDLITPFISQPLVNMSGSKHLLQANTVFRNEPFGS
jgi:Flp pilus assembly protein TadG